jgi:hypothetical protein
MSIIGKNLAMERKGNVQNVNGVCLYVMGLSGFYSIISTFLSLYFLQ